MEALVIILFIIFVIWFSKTSQKKYEEDLLESSRQMACRREFDRQREMGEQEFAQRKKAREQDLVNRQKKYEQELARQHNVVRATSSCYQSLLSLNQEYSFYSDFPLHRTLSARVTSKRQFDTFDFDSMLDHHISSHLDVFAVFISHIEQNQQNYHTYFQRVNQLHPSISNSTQVAAAHNIPLQTYMDIENDLISKSKICPKISMQITCRVTYDTPKQQNHYENEKIYYLSDIKSHYQQITLDHYAHSAQKYQQQYERLKVTASLRYDVLKRDNFRCQICGATQRDGVKLHVDHILPISKGGKTEMENLRTLCDRCNLGKGSKIE